MPKITKKKKVPTKPKAKPKKVIKSKTKAKAKKKGRTGRLPKINKEVEVVILELIANGHTMVAICKQLNMTRNTEWVYRQKDENEEYRKKFEDAMQARIAIVEDSLFSKAKDGDVPAMKFFLSNVSPKRWRTVVDHRVGGEEPGKGIKVQVTEVVVEIPKDAAQQMAEEEAAEALEIAEKAKKKEDGA